MSANKNSWWDVQVSLTLKTPKGDADLKLWNLRGDRMPFDINGEGGDWPLKEINAENIAEEFRDIGHELTEDQVTLVLTTMLKVSLNKRS